MVHDARMRMRIKQTPAELHHFFQRQQLPFEVSFNGSYIGQWQEPF
jgi:hypothetical protein